MGSLGCLDNSLSVRFVLTLDIPFHGFSGFILFRIRQLIQTWGSASALGSKLPYICSNIGSLSALLKLKVMGSTGAVAAQLLCFVLDYLTDIRTLYMLLSACLLPFLRLSRQKQDEV